ncbi:MAG: hypothetical protein P8X80_18745, partial [Desulfobacterales bacterium]
MTRISVLVWLFLLLQNEVEPAEININYVSRLRDGTATASIQTQQTVTVNPKKSSLKTSFKWRYVMKKLSILCLCLLLFSVTGFSNAFAASAKATSSAGDLATVRFNSA